MSMRCTQRKATKYLEDKHGNLEMGDLRMVVYSSCKLFEKTQYVA